MKNCFERGKVTFFHVILTTECNLQCRYCYGEALKDTDGCLTGLEIDYSLPRTINYDLGLLGRFCRQDPDCILIFCGGEPLLCIDEVEQIMDHVEAKHFLIQTNGLFLDQLEQKHVNRFHTILVSIDGDEALTDFYRGKATFEKVIDNLQLVKRNDFKGELIARMTVMEQTDIHNQVKWLLNNDEFSFSSVHWQLNAGFWNDFSRRNFKRWIEESYNPGIRSLVKFWVDYMERNGVVLRLYPFLGIAQSFLLGEKASLLRCGAGWMNYAIQTDGNIIPCPSMWGIKDHYVGHITSADPLKLKKIFVNNPCAKCDIFHICGGRCLYANVMKRWNPEAYTAVCTSVRNLINAILEQVPRINKLIDKRKINIEDFEFMRYNGCEIIP